MKEIILIGGGGHCKSCIDVIEQEGEYTISGIIDTKEVIGSKVMGYPVIGCDENLPSLSKKYQYALITLGQIQTAEKRIKLFNLLNGLEFTLPTIISPTAYVSQHSSIQKGSIVMNHVFINAACHIGENCIINTAAIIEHDVTIGNHCHISTGAVVNGGVKIGNEVFYGSNTTSKEGIQIPNKTFIKAGNLVK
jgi:sugar O-acyltransferase (sialic acid O-acetyltransferase NeuD family)